MPPEGLLHTPGEVHVLYCWVALQQLDYVYINVVIKVEFNGFIGKSAQNFPVFRVTGVSIIKRAYKVGKRYFLVVAKLFPFGRGGINKRRSAIQAWQHIPKIVFFGSAIKPLRMVILWPFWVKRANNQCFRLKVEQVKIKVFLKFVVTGHEFEIGAR